MTDIWEIAAIAAKFALYLGVLISTGTAFAALTFQISHYRLRALGFALLAVLAALVSFALNGAALTGDASGMTDPEMLGLLWSTPVGSALLLRLVGMTLLIIGLCIWSLGEWVACLGGCLALWSFAQIGHIPDQDFLWLNLVLLAHLIGIAAWIGILVPLSRLARAGEIARAARLGERFGTVAMIFVPFLILAGLVMTYQLVGSVAAMTGTDYGRVLLFKVVVVAALLALAAKNKLNYVPRLKAGDIAAAPQLARSITLEWCAIIAILLASAVLTSVLPVP